MSDAFDFNRPLLLDGGTGRELLKRGVPILTEIWSATALLLAPEIVRQVHDDFITAGAESSRPTPTASRASAWRARGSRNAMSS